MMRRKTLRFQGIFSLAKVFWITYSALSHMRRYSEFDGLWLLVPELHTLFVTVLLWQHYAAIGSDPRGSQLDARELRALLKLELKGKVREVLEGRQELVACVGPAVTLYL